MHFVQLDDNLRKRSRSFSLPFSFVIEGQYFCTCHATRRPLRRATRRDATSLPPTRVGQRRRSPFVYPPCRPSCQSRNGVTDTRFWAPRRRHRRHRRRICRFADRVKRYNHRSFRVERAAFGMLLRVYVPPFSSPLAPSVVVCFRRTWGDARTRTRRG